MATLELSKYVAEQLSKGVPLEQIKRALLKSGWTSRDLEQTLNAQQSIAVKQSTFKKYLPSIGLKSTFFLTFKNRVTRQLRREALMAGFLVLPLLWLPLLAGIGLYRGFWWQLIVAAVLGAAIDMLYCLTLRRLLTPVLHPKRIQLSWLIFGPPLALLLLWLGHIPFITACAAALILGLLISAGVGGTLIFDALASAIGFGCLYVVLFVLLRIPLHGPTELISSLSGIEIFSRPVEQLGLVFLFGALWGPLLAVTRHFTKSHTTSNNNYHTKHQFAKRIVLSLFALLVSVGSYSVYSKFVKVPVVLAAFPANGDELKSLTAPITVTFNKPIDRGILKVSISPTVQGDLSFSDPYLQRTFVRQVTFTPKGYLTPGTTYSVHIENIQNILGHQNSSHTFSFHTPSLPTVATTSIQNGQKNVAICSPINVVLTQPVNKFEEFTFQLTPAVPLDQTLGQDAKTYTLTPKNCLAQSTAYSFAVQRRLTVYDATGLLINSADLPITLNTISFTTKGAPGISNFSPQGNGVLGTVKHLVVSFSEEMNISNSSSDIAIVPPAAGSWHWLDSHTLTYDISNNLQLDTTYTVTIPHGLKDTYSGFLSTDAVFSFTTVGHVQISAILPRPGSGGVSVATPIRITFDQPVDQNSAQDHFSLSPATTGSFSWQGQTMFYLTTLTKDSTYQVTETPGVVSLIGLPSGSGALTRFQTEESVLLLNIPVYYQQRSLSCEAASLKMALNYKGNGISESSLLNAIGDDTTPRQGNIWGDPYQAFVGDVTGHQNSTGYGVYAGPIAAIGSQYRSTQVLSNMGTVQVASNLSQGNPVIFWGTAGNARPDQWTTPAGRQINAWIGEHVRLLIGFTGPVSHPTSFIINDPIFGRLVWSPSQLQANWSAFNGMGVVIF